MIVLMDELGIIVCLAFITKMLLMRFHAGDFLI